MNLTTRSIPVIVLAALCLPQSRDAEAQAIFTDAERDRIIAYWNAPGRCSVSAPPEASSLGPWQVRLTVESSVWLFAYARAVGSGKAPPTVDAAASAPDNVEWEEWVRRKVACDRWSAQVNADDANAILIGTPFQRIAPAEPPLDPGPIPPGLAAAVGTPPPFAAAVTPMEHTIVFEGGDTYRYQTHVNVRPRYAKYRFSNGTVAYGGLLRDIPEETQRRLFEGAGLSPLERRVMVAVSKLEGGFDAVNTYDTGYVSVGFIQFILHEDGKHSLIEVLKRERADDAAAFVDDFRRFGVDVNAEGAIVVLDIATGAELSGKAAVMKIIDDKRFAALFQRAGKRSTAFRLAQIRAARSLYWPGDDPIRVTVGGRIIEGKVSDVVKSEAGLATLFDRKVNRGTIEPFGDVIVRIMAEKGLRSLSQLADYEREIVRALKYRADFLADNTLSQPR